MNSIVNHKAIRSAPEEGLHLPIGLLFRLSSAQTDGALEVVELEGPGVPLPHVHHDHDECFYILEGLFTFMLGKEEVEAQAGSLVFVPRGTPHAFKHSEGARALFFVMPAGLEGFFREMGEGLREGRAETDVRAELAGKYDAWPVG